MCFHTLLYGDFHWQTHSLFLSNSTEIFSWSIDFSCPQNAGLHYSLITHSLIKLADHIGFGMVHRGILQSTLCDIEKLLNISILCFLSLSQFLIDWCPLTISLQK